MVENQPITEKIVSRELKPGDTGMLTKGAIVQLGPRGQDWVTQEEGTVAVVRIAQSSKEQSMFKNIGKEPIPLWFNGAKNEISKGFLFSSKTRYFKKK